MIRPPPISTLFPYTTLFRSFKTAQPETTGWRRVLSHAPFIVLILLCLISRSEEHTSELQSQFHLVCRLLLEKKKTLQLKNGCHLHKSFSLQIKISHHCKLA